MHWRHCKVWRHFSFFSTPSQSGCHFQDIILHPDCWILNLGVCASGTRVLRVSRDLLLDSTLGCTIGNAVADICTYSTDAICEGWSGHVSLPPPLRSACSIQDDRSVFFRIVFYRMFCYAERAHLVGIKASLSSPVL